VSQIPVSSCKIYALLPILWAFVYPQEYEMIEIVKIM
jgi:hypothetical protein